MIRKYIYIAGPYTHPEDSMPNVKKAIDTADALIDAGKKMGINVVPFIPHLCHFWEQHGIPKDYKTWMQFDESWLEKCDAMFVISRSPGVDAEIAFAAENKIIVIEDCEPGQLQRYFNHCQRLVRRTGSREEAKQTDSQKKASELMEKIKKNVFLHFTITMIAKLFIICFLVTCALIPMIIILGLIQIAKSLITVIL